MTPRRHTIEELAASISSLARRAVAEYAPIVSAIVSQRSHDTRQIEHTLDGLLDFCFDPEALLLYKKLCRHYSAIDPAATAGYVRAYRELWDSPPERRDECATRAWPQADRGGNDAGGLGFQGVSDLLEPNRSIRFGIVQPG